VNINWSDPAIQGVLIGGLIGLGGAVVGGLGAAFIAAGAARQDRAEGRVRRFEDRSLELAALYLESGRRYRNWVFERFNGRPPPYEVDLDDRFPQYYRELRLILRQPATLQALDQLDNAVWDLGLWKDDAAADNVRQQEFREADRVYRLAMRAFEDAIREELRVGRRPKTPS
jgi:hypothetical protein